MYANIPSTTVESLIRHILYGRGGGHFITAVLSNDLKGSFDRADEPNARAMREIVRWLYNRAPTGCWGGVDLVEMWRSHGGLNGIAQSECAEWLKHAVKDTQLEHVAPEVYL